MNSTEKNNLTMSNFTFLWFGAAISIAEMLTGGLIAPLGFQTGVFAILLGHLAGTTLLVLGGIIGTQERIPALMSTRISFGEYGSYLFSILNVLQLIGWTAVMIIAGARSVNGITKILWSFDNLLLWSVVIGGCIFIWIILGKEGWKKLNMLAVFLLFILTLVLSYIVMGNHELLTKEVVGTMSLAEAVELSAVMPLSWLPLIADYTRYAKDKKSAAWGSWIGYFFGSCWMYIIGLGAAIVAGEADPAAMMLAANLGIFALGIVVLATVTTTFMDAYSAGVTFLNIFPRWNEKTVALAMTVIGTVLAIIVDMEQYENFLYAIGSVFAPLFAILLTDYFILKNKKIQEALLVNWGAAFNWVVGVVLYYQFINFQFVLGATIPVMVITGCLNIAICRYTVKWRYLRRAAEDC